MTTTTPQDEQVILIPGYGPTTPRKRWIASVHFADCTLNLNHWRKKEYHLPAPKHKGEVSVLEVTDAQQVGMVPSADPQEQPTYAPKIVAVEGIVQDLLKEWAGGFTGMLKGFRPGIFEIKGPVPSEAEKRRLLDAQHKFCVQAVAEGDLFHIDPKRGRIQQLHREAHKWLQEGNPQFKTHSWATQELMIQTKTGAASGLPIPLGARYDAGQNLVELYLRDGLNPLDYQDTFLAKEVEERREEMKKSSAPAPKR